MEKPVLDLSADEISLAIREEIATDFWWGEGVGWMLKIPREPP